MTIPLNKIAIIPKMKIAFRTHGKEIKNTLLHSV